MKFAVLMIYRANGITSKIVRVVRAFTILQAQAFAQAYLIKNIVAERDIESLATVAKPLPAGSALVPSLQKPKGSN